MSPGKGCYKVKAIPMPKGKGKLVGSGVFKQASKPKMCPEPGSARRTAAAGAGAVLLDTCPGGSGASVAPPTHSSQLTPIVVRHRLTRTPVLPGSDSGEPETRIKSSHYDGALRSEPTQPPAFTLNLPSTAVIDIQPGQETIEGASANGRTPCVAAHSDAEEDSPGSLQFLETSTMSAGGAAGQETVPVRDAPRLAARLLKNAVTELDKSRNLHRDIKEAVLAGLHALHGMVLRLADSRARHLAERERARALSDRQYALQQRVYTNKLETITECMQTNMDELRETAARSLREAEGARQLVERVMERLEERQAAPEEAAKFRLVGQLLEEAHAIREEYCNSPMAARDLAPGSLAEAAATCQRRPAEAPHMPSSAVPDRAGARISYARAAKHPLIVRSKNPAHTGDDILAQIKTNVDVIGLGVGINGVRKCKNSTLAISLESPREKEIMSGAILALGDTLQVSEPAQRDPLLRLQGVLAELADARIADALLGQNAPELAAVPEMERKVKVVRRIRGRNASLHNIVLQVSPALWAALVDRRLRIGYQMIQAVDQSPLLQCYRCLGFSHRVAECRAPERKCGHCAEGHDTRECPNRECAPCCVNCRSARGGLRDARHLAYSSQCPEWQRWDRIARLSTRYC